MEQALAPYLSLLKDSGLKLTPKRKAVIRLFLKAQRTLAPQEVHQRLQRIVTPLGLPTVYRILEELTAINVLISVVSQDRLLAYALCARPRVHQHHFFCRGCQRVEEVDYCGIIEAGKRIQKKLGCRIDSHLFQVEGMCADCLKKKR